VPEKILSSFIYFVPDEWSFILLDTKTVNELNKKLIKNLKMQNHKVTV
jgi:hypothetical protein